MLAKVITPWQERDFAALDDAWIHLAGLPAGVHTSHTESIRRAYLERPRGHSKTTDMAVQIAWILQAAREPVYGLAAAADRDQGELLHRATVDLIRANHDLCHDLAFKQHVVLNRATGSQLEVVSSDVSSSWGQLPDFVICDELCHWDREDLWYSLLSSAAKKPNCVLAVLTNAGVGRGWQWQVREQARNEPNWHFSTLQGPQAPWMRASFLEEQRRLLPPAVYGRLWLNEWQHSDGAFVSLEEADRCCDATRRYEKAGRRGYRYIAAIDYAEKRDRTVGVVIHREGNEWVVDRMDVVAPSPNRPTPVQWVEDWMLEVADSFPVVRFVVDEYQLLAVLQRYEGRWNIKRFSFAGGKGNHALAMALRQLIIEGTVRWYPGCGQLDGFEQRDDLGTELASLLLRTVGTGRVRIDHRNEAGYHDDRAFALGAACLEGLQEAPQPEWIAIQQPAHDGSFGWY